MTYRNNFFYYLLMPGLWMAGVLFYLGVGAVYTVLFRGQADGHPRRALRLALGRAAVPRSRAAP